MSQTPKLGNPAVVGLAGFGLTTFVLQMHNLGLCSLGPVLALAVIFGGLAQFIAGFQEQKMGNNFGFCAFTGYGAFWIAFALIQFGNRYEVFKSSGTDVGYFLIAFTIFTAILWVGSLKVSKGLAAIFTTLLLGFLLLDLGHFGDPMWNKVAAVELIVCAFCALYGMAHAVYADVWGRDVLPMGKPFL